MFHPNGLDGVFGVAWGTFVASDVVRGLVLTPSASRIRKLGLVIGCLATVQYSTRKMYNPLDRKTPLGFYLDICLGLRG